jgi:O-antigen ligase
LAVTAVGTALLVAGLLFTGSRSAFLGVLVGLVLVFVVKSIPSMNVARPVSAVLATLAVLGSLFGSFFFTDLASSIRGGGVNEERSLIERVSLYEDFVPFMASTNIIVGHGIGSYVLSISDNQPGKNAFDYQPIHNVFLLIFAEIGVLGLIAALCVVASVVRINFSRFPRHDALYAFGMGNVIFMVCFFDHYLWSSWSGLALIAFVLAMMVRMGENSA